MTKKIAVLIIISFVSLFSCASHKEPGPSSFDKRLLVRMQSLVEPDKQVAEPLQNKEKSGMPVRETFKPVAPLKYSSGRQLRGMSPEKFSFSKTKMVSVAADTMSLPAFIHYIFSDIFDVNYIVDSKIERNKKTVTLNLNREISESALFDMVVDIMKQHKIAVYEKGDIYYLWMGSDDRPAMLGVGASLKDIPISTGEIRQLVPIKYIDVLNMSQFLSTTPGVKIYPAFRENMLVVMGKREQIEQTIRMINILDRPAMRGRFIGMRRLEFWSVTDMAAKLSEILQQEGIPVAKQPGSSGVYINKIEQRGIIIIFAAEKQWLQRVEYWVDILDTPQQGDEKQYFLYFPQNSRAEELGESLAKILGIDGVNFLEKSLQLRENNPSDSKKTNGKEVMPVKETVAQDKGITAGNVRIAVDKNRNGLIIYATLKKYNALHRLLKKLDVMPVQVLIEATIAEVTLKDSLAYGLEWYLKDSAGAQSSILQTLGGLGLGSGGLNYSLVTDSDMFKVLINALVNEDMVKILSSPRVTVRDGKTASFVVGTEVPIVTSETSSPDIVADGTSGIIRTIQYRSTGISIKVTPSVQAENIVTLEINQEISEAQTNDTSDISSPLILNRTISTDVVAADGQTILIAGLIKETKSNTAVKVPLLGNIPYLGYLFKTKSDSVDRTELVVMITPRIIRSAKEIDELREAIFKSFENISIEKWIK